MATVFSTATLGLSVDNKEFNKAMRSSEKVAVDALLSASAQTDAFHARWKEMTGGLKDTKRIISGILVSQGFYALSNALVGAAAAALDFSMSMETAAVSLEYFVDAAAGTEEAAQQVTAYLREVNNFAARTPFSTDDVLTLSKYMQAVGVAMSQTQSVLSVITDTAAATGASEENLQRITFALGQMLTKGRIANEEIRQLANANIPIYQILQEELGLTGEQISNIGNYWVDAETAVVAILRGLDKRYAGAADKIAATLTGLTDTIVDDAKIIADQAFAGIYDRVVNVAGTLRDTLDEWRTIVTEQGAAGLANHLLIEIDPTGEIGNQILALVGNIRQLAGAALDLYHAAKPLIGVFGQSMYASLNLATIALTALSDVVSGLIEFMDDAGISSTALAQGIASLYVAYKATQFVSLLGQACVTAGVSAYQAASGIVALLPASLSARSGVVALTASVASLIAYLAAAAGIFGALNNSFAGLENGGGGLNDSWEKAYADYAAQMKEHNAVIEAQQEKYRQSYEEMAGDSTITVEKEDEDDATGGGGGDTKNDWVAAFDEVYDVPDDDGTGAYQDEVLADLGELLGFVANFRFPTIAVPEVEVPKMENIYGDSLWDADYLKNMLPAIITGAVISAGKVFAKQREKIDGKTVKDGIEKGGKGTVIVTDEQATAQLQKLVKQVETGQQQLDNLFKQLREDIRKATTLDNSTQSYITLGATAKSIERLSGELSKLSDDAGYYGKLLGKQINAFKLSAEQQQLLMHAQVISITRQIESVSSELQHLTAETAGLAPSLRTKLDELKKQLLAVSGRTTVSGSPADYIGTIEQLNNYGAKLDKAITALAEQPFIKEEGKPRIYNEKALQEINEALTDGQKVLKEFKTLYGDTHLYTVTRFEEALGQLKAIDGHVVSSFQKALETAAGFNATSHKLGSTVIRGVNTANALGAMTEKNATKILDKVVAIAAEMRKVTPEAIADAVTAAEKRKARIDELTAKSEADAAAREEQRRLDREARDKALLEEQQARRQARGRRLDATVIEPGSASKAVAAIEEASNENIRKLAELKDELRQAIDAQKDWLSYGDTEQAAKTAKTIESLRKEIAALEEALPKKLDDNVSKLVGLTAEQKAQVLSIEEKLAARLTPAPGIADQTAQALESWRNSFSEDFLKYLSRTGIELNNLALTATKTVTALKGVSDWGTTFPQLMAEAFKEQGWFAGRTPGLPDPTYVPATERGVVLEKYFGAATEVNLSAANVNVHQGGHAAREGAGLIVQYDFAASGDFSKLFSHGTQNGIAAIDIKTVSPATIDKLKPLITPVTKGVYKADGSILGLMGRTDNMYELMAQSWVFSGNAGHQFASFVNTGFDFEGMNTAFVEKVIQTYNNSAYRREGTAVGGRIFSDDAYNFAAKTHGGNYSWAQFDADIIGPLLTDIRTNLSFEKLADAVTTVALDFSKMLSDIDMPGLATAYVDAAKLFALTGKQGNAYLLSYAKTANKANQLVGAIDLAPTLSRLTQASKSLNKFAQQILRDTSVSFRGGSVSNKFRVYLDKLVSDYTLALSSGSELATQAFVTKIDELRSVVESLRTGSKVSDDFIDLFGKVAEFPAKYAPEVRLLSDVLDSLVAGASDANRLVSTMYSVNRGINQLKTAANTGGMVYTKSLDGLVTNYRTLCNLLSLSNDTMAIRTGNALQAIQRYVSEQGGEALLTPNWVRDIELPISFSNIHEAAELTAAQIAQGIQNGTITLGKRAGALLEEALSGYDLSSTPVDPILKQLKAANQLPSNLVVGDLETTGLLQTTAAGTRVPAITQATLSDAYSDKTLNRYIITGNAEQDYANLLKMQSITDSSGALSDVAKAWQAVSFEEYIGNGVTIEQFFKEAEELFGKGFALTGWNATGTTGFDDQLLRYAGAPEGLYYPVDDVMAQFSDLVKELTGKSRSFKLVDAHEILFGKLELSAHLSDNDVDMTKDILRALQSGDAQRVIATADPLTVGKGNLVENLKEVGKTFRMSSTYADEFAEEVSYAAQAAKEIKAGVVDAASAATTASDVVQEASESAARSTFAEGFEKATSGIRDSVADWFKSLSKDNAIVDVFKRWFGKTPRSAAPFYEVENEAAESTFKRFTGRSSEPYYRPMNVDELAQSWIDAAIKLEDAKEALAQARLDGATEDVIKKLQTAVDDATRGADDAMTGLYRGIITTTKDALDDTSKEVLSSFTKYVKEVDAAGDYIALYYDKTSRTFKTVGDTLNINGSEMVQRLSTSVKYVEDAAGYLNDIATQVALGNMSAETAVKHLDTLADLLNVKKSEALERALKVLSESLGTGLGKLDTNLNRYVKAFTQDMPDIDGATRKLTELIGEVKAGRIAVGDFSDEVGKFLDTIDVQQTAGMRQALSNITTELDEGLGAIHKAATDYAGLLQPELSKVAGDLSSSIDEIIKSAGNGKVSAQLLDEFAQLLDKEIGDTLLILNTQSGATEFAGKAAREAVEQAAGDIATGIGTLTKKILTASVGMFSAFDLIGPLIDSVIEAVNLEKLQEQTGTIIAGLTSDNTQAMFADAKINLEDMLGETVYRGIEEALGQSALITLISSGVGTAVGLGIAGAATQITGATVAAFTGPVGWIAAAAAAITGIIATGVVNATGGNTNSYKYWDEYGEALESGQFIDTTALVEELVAKGYSKDEAEKAANEANEAAHVYYYQDIVNNASTDSFWESGDVRKLLHGTPQFMQGPGGTGIVQDYNDTLRLGQAAGLVDVGSHTFTENVHGASLSRTVLTVKDEEQLDVLAELLGVERSALSISEEIVDTQNVHGYNMQTPTGEYRVMLDGKEIMYSDVDIDRLADAYQMTGGQGFMSGEVGQEITGTITGNKMLTDAYGEISYGGGDNWLTAQGIFEDFLKSYNAANGTNLTVDYLDEIGATQSMLKSMVDIYETQSALWYNEAVQRNAITSENREVLAGDTASMLNGVDITGWSSNMLAELASYGLNFAAGEYLVNTPMGEQNIDYATVTTDYEALRENMAGVLVGNTTLADGTVIDVANLQVSAADAEILAQAGIQINSDGTISFMNAQNDGSTGAERNLSLDADAFSKNVLDALTGVGISVNFEAGELDFGDFTGLTEDMYAALFKMPDNINMQLSDEMRDVIAQIGTVTESGFLQITNEAILSGNKTIASFIEEAGITVDELSPQVYESLMTIDALIQAGGGTIQENILAWSNGVVVPSPIKEEQLTEEMRLAFESIGIHFQEYGGQFMMVINQTGEMLTNGISLIDAEKWLELDESVRVALEGLGVTATTVGNQMMIDLNGVFDGGVANIISLFINQPEVWAQIPDTVKAALEQSGIITGEQLIQIQTTLTGGLTEITGGWVTAWSTLGPECAKYLEEAGINTQEGLAQVTQYVGDADIGTVVDEGVIVPFESLPPELKTQMELAGENVEGTKVLLQTATETAVGGMLGVLDQTVTDAGDYATELGNTIATAVSTAMIQLQNLQQLQGQVGSSDGFLGIGAKDNLIDYQGTTVGGTTYYKEYTTGGSTVKYWYIDPSTGQWNTRTTLPARAEGGPASGLTLAGELGEELAILPDGSIQWVSAGVYDFPDGTQIINAEDSAAVAKYAGRISSLSKLADGNTELSVEAEEPVAASDEFIAKLRALLLEVFFGVTDEEDAAALQSEQAEQAASTATAMGTMLQPMLQNELRGAEEITAVAIRNAVDAVLQTSHENMRTLLASHWAQFQSYDTAQQDALITKILEGISSAASSIASSVGSTISSLKSTISSMSSTISSLRSYGSGASGTGAINNGDSEDRAQYGGSVYDQQHLTTAELKAAQSVREAAEAGETTWKDAHDFVETLRNQYGYSGGSDGSAYIKVDVDSEGNTNVRYSGSTISANAYGGLITDDTILRAGEFGKDEAIVPLEQPSVMAKLGSAIAENTPEEQGITLTALQEMLKTELYAATEIVAVAIKNATATLGTDNSEISKLTISTLTGNHEIIVARLDGNHVAVLEAISSAASSIASSVGSYVSSLKSTISSMSSAISSMQAKGVGSGGSGLSDEERAALGGSAYDQANFTDDQLKAAADIRAAAEAGETSWKDAHAFVEELRSGYGYSGGADGSSYIKVEVESDGKTTVTGGGNTVKANAYGGLITADTILRAGEFGKKEAILPLEQPSVMAKLGSSIAAYTDQPEETALITLDGLQVLLQAELYNASEIIATAIRNAADMLDSNSGDQGRALLATLSEQHTTLSSLLSQQHTSLLTSMESIVTSAASSIASSVGSYVSSLKSTISSMSSTISGLQSQVSKGNGTGSGSLSSDERAALGGSAYDQANFTDAQLQAAADVRAAAEAGATTWADAHAFVEEIRSQYGYSGGTDGSAYIKGSAKGSLITKDALYRAGELGLNEAIIPLEQPDVLKQVGSTIASYMPVETVELGAALGMQNAGITPVAPPAPAFDPSAMVSAVTQHVLESVLPAMSAGSAGESTGTPVYVGTLIADDKGLKQLERKLYKIRMLEEARRT